MLQELKLPPLQERRKRQRLATLYKISNGLIKALPPEKYLIPTNKNKRKIRPRTFQGCETTNIIARHATNNTKAFKIPEGTSKQYRCSFFVKTIEDWNHLDEDTVQASTAAAFTSAVGRLAQN